MSFDDWVKELDEQDVPRYQKLYDSWYKHDNSELEWQRYYWTLRKAYEAGTKHV